MYGDNAPPADVMTAAIGQEVTTINVLGLPPIVVAPAQRLNSSGVLEYILGDDVVLLSNPTSGTPNDGTRMASALTFRTRGRGGNGWTKNEYIPQSNRGGLEKGVMMEAGYKEIDFLPSNIV